MISADRLEMDLDLTSVIIEVAPWCFLPSLIGLVLALATYEVWGNFFLMVSLGWTLTVYLALPMIAIFGKKPYNKYFLQPKIDKLRTFELLKGK